MINEATEGMMSREYRPRKVRLLTLIMWLQLRLGFQGVFLVYF